MTGTMRRILPVLCVGCMLVLGCFSLARADSPTLKDVRTAIGENLVAYPQLEGLADEIAQQAVNDDIILRGDIAKHLVSLSTLGGNGLSLVVDYQAFLHSDVLSITFSAKGQMPNGREGQAFTALTYDLQTGKPIKAAELFTQLEDAAAKMEEILEMTLTEELSGYLNNSEFMPLPVENFALDEDGITFYYPYSQLSLVSGYAGAGQFYYEELADWLNWDGVLGRLDVKPKQMSDAQIKEAVRETVASGRLLHVPVKIGDTLPDVVARYRLLREPDQYPAGKYYQMEAPIFRQVLVLSDALTGGYEHSVVEGLQSTRLSLFGIQPGITARERWREILGEPEQTATFNESLAYDYGIPSGESDFYTFGEYQLRLHADEAGILHSIRLMK
ncbi:MAG: DUF3298 domain-containing protein [Clostridiales bacterium]|nr:DUF3298 domain-containing protein [Clostridiales bacterium]